MDKPTKSPEWEMYFLVFIIEFIALETRIGKREINRSLLSLRLLRLVNVIQNIIICNFELNPRSYDKYFKTNESLHLLPNSKLALRFMHTKIKNSVCIFLLLGVHPCRL